MWPGFLSKYICVYAIAVTTNGGEYMELMNMQEIEKCRAVSKASSSPHSPWVKWFDQMAKKTVMHRIAKRLPKNDAINSVVAVDDDNFVDVTPNAKPSEPKDSLSRLRFLSQVMLFFLKRFFQYGSSSSNLQKVLG